MVFFRDSINRPRAEDDPEGMHAHVHTADDCEDLLDRVNNLEAAVAQIIDMEGPDEDPLPDDTSDDAGPDPNQRIFPEERADRSKRILPREEWADASKRTVDEPATPDDYLDAGSGPAKNKNVGTPKVDVPESKLPDIADINRKNAAFWTGGLTNQSSSPNSIGSIDMPARLSTTPKQLDPGRTFGVTADSLQRAQVYKAQADKQRKLVAAITAKNDKFYARRGGR